MGVSDVLIVGYGRAGQRHARLLDELGVSWGYIDKRTDLSPPSNIELLTSLEDIDVRYLCPKCAAVCTPPDDHLRHVRLLLEAGVEKILCEKPLCGLGQLDEARELADEAGDRVSVAYNWRWHPDIAMLTNEHGLMPVWTLYSEQARPHLPAWGLLLDHVSHGVDTMRHLTGEEPKLRWAVHNYADFTGPDGEVEATREQWLLDGWAGQDFQIVEAVTNHERGPRQCWAEGPWGKINLDTSPAAMGGMHLGMWEDVLRWVDSDGPPPVSMADALGTQAVLEKAHHMQMGTFR